MWAHLRDEVRKLGQVESHLYTQAERRASRHQARLELLGIMILATLCGGIDWWVAPIIFFLGFAAWAMLFTTRERRRFLRGFFSYYRDKGMARKLIGDLHYQVVFVTPRRRERTKEKEALSALDGALAFLSKEGRRFGHEVRFHPPTKRPLTIVFRRPRQGDEHRIHAGYKRKLQRKILRLPYREQTPQGDGFFLIVFTTGGDYRATAFPASRETSEDTAPEYCFCPDDSSSTTVAHEILHLFGARDLYEEGTPSNKFRDELRRRAKSEVSEEQAAPRIEDSIMLSSSNSLESVTVDRATAFSVGWLDELHAAPHR